MKFGKQLQLGIYEPWTELKRLIERSRLNSKLPKNDSDEDIPKSVTESSPLVTKTKKADSFYDRTGSAIIEEAYVDEFFPLLEQELLRINKFYVGKLSEIRLSFDLIQVKRDNWYQSHHTGNKPSDLYIIRDMYIECKALISYQKLNRTGFVKIVKKYDKIMHEENLNLWTSKLAAAPFAVSNDAEHLFASIESLVSRGTLVEWERYAAETIGKPTNLIFPTVQLQSLVTCLIIFFVTYMIPWHFGDGDPAANRCLALMLFVVSMWVSKAIPYFATALLIPVLVTVLGVLKDAEGKPLEPQQASSLVLSSMTTHTTFLLLGGYTISSAFARCELEQNIASWLQQRLGHSPRLFILAVMFLGLFLSMWISNHTAPILCTSILTPILQDLPQKCRFTRGLLLGLAFACNFGGMATPISSLQNALAVGQLQEIGITVAFGHWLMVSVPFCILGVFLSWLMLLIFVQPDDVNVIPPVVIKEGNAEISAKRNVAVIAFCAVIVVLLASSEVLKPYVGDIGILSLSFLVLMFGSGILTEVDFNSLSWHTLFLLGGGNVLGMAISSSNLLTYLANMIIEKLPYDDPWITLLIVLCFCLLVATFVSHSVASLILMPIITEVGLQLGTPKTFVMGAAFAVSAGMALPFSSFPNVNSMLVVDDFQRPYLTTHDFMLTGGILSIVTVLLIATLGYVLIEHAM